MAVAGGTTKGFYKNNNNNLKKKQKLCTNKPFGISSEPAISSEEMNLKDIESWTNKGVLPNEQQWFIKLVVC